MKGTYDIVLTDVNTGHKKHIVQNNAINPAVLETLKGVMALSIREGLHKTGAMVPGDTVPPAGSVYNNDSSVIAGVGPTSIYLLDDTSIQPSELFSFVDASLTVAWANPDAHGGTDHMRGTFIPSLSFLHPTRFKLTFSFGTQYGNGTFSKLVCACYKSSSPNSGLNQGNTSWRTTAVDTSSIEGVERAMYISKAPNGVYFLHGTGVIDGASGYYTWKYSNGAWSVLPGTGTRAKNNCIYFEGRLINVDYSRVSFFDLDGNLIQSVNTADYIQSSFQVSNGYAYYIAKNNYVCRLNLNTYVQEIQSFTNSSGIALSSSAYGSWNIPYDWTIKGLIQDSTDAFVANNSIMYEVDIEALYTRKTLDISDIIQRYVSPVSKSSATCFLEVLNGSIMIEGGTVSCKAFRVAQFGTAYVFGSSSEGGIYEFGPNIFSIANLDSPVTKLATQTMEVSYTLEVDGGPTPFYNI